MTQKRTPILVTGAHRSGTTFVGHILSIPLNVGYVQEPFNPVHGLSGVDEWFPYVTRGGRLEDSYQNLMRDLLSLDATYQNPWRDGSTHLRRLARRLAGSEPGLRYRTLTLRPFLDRLLLKDPIACLSAEWLHREFDMDVVLLIRHPAAFVGSLRRLGWRFDLKNFSRRPDLMNDHLEGLISPHEEYDDLSDVEEGAILWNCLYRVLTTYADRNPGMIVKTHEGISADPIGEFRDLFGRLDLRFGHRVEHAIMDRTMSGNPVDPSGNKAHVMKRNSAANVKRWHKLFTKNEIDHLRARTHKLSSMYYRDDDW